MKTLLIFLLLVVIIGLSFSAYSQKQFKWPKPVKDSTWIEAKDDTLHGIIEYQLGNGKIIGEGIVVTTEYTHWSKPIYSTKDQKRIDSFNTEQRKSNKFIIWDMGQQGYGGTDENRTVAFIKTTKGYKWVSGPYTFTPSKHWSDSYVFGLLNKILRLIPSK